MLFDGAVAALMVGLGQMGQVLTGETLFGVAELDIPENPRFEEFRYMLPAQIQFGRFHRHQAAAAKGIAQGQARDAANAQARLDRPFDRLGVFQLQADVQRLRMMAHGLVEGQAGAGALFAQNPCLAGQLL